MKLVVTYFKKGEPIVRKLLCTVHSSEGEKEARLRILKKHIDAGNRVLKIQRLEEVK